MGNNSVTIGTNDEARARLLGEYEAQGSVTQFVNDGLRLLAILGLSAGPAYV